MSRTACLGMNCTRIHKCRLHTSNLARAVDTIERLCRVGTHEDFEPITRSKPVGSWEGKDLPAFRNLASVFWLARQQTSTPA